MRPLILISDDERATADRVAEALRPHGFDVLIDSRSEVVRMATLYRPTLILLDLLQRVDGLALLRQLKSEALTCSIPVVMGCPAIGSIEERCLFAGRARRAGAVSVLSKPYTDKALAHLPRLIAMIGEARADAALAA